MYISLAAKHGISIRLDHYSCAVHPSSQQLKKNQRVEKNKPVSSFDDDLLGWSGGVACGLVFLPEKESSHHGVL